MILEAKNRHIILTVLTTPVKLSQWLEAVHLLDLFLTGMNRYLLRMALGMK